MGVSGLVTGCVVCCNLNGLCRLLGSGCALKTGALSGSSDSLLFLTSVNLNGSTAVGGFFSTWGLSGPLRTFLLIGCALILNLEQEISANVWREKNYFLASSNSRRSCSSFEIAVTGRAREDVKNLGVCPTVGAEAFLILLGEGLDLKRLGVPA